MDISGKLRILISGIFAFMMLCILILCGFFSDMEYLRNDFVHDFYPMFALLGVGLVLLVITFFLTSYIEKLPDRIWKIVKFTLPVILLIIQITFVSKYFFYTDWDVGIIDVITTLIAHDGDVSGFSSFYYSMYPNNAFIIWFFSHFKMFIHSLGFHDSEYLSMIILQCVINSVTCLLSMSIIEKSLKSKHLSLLGFIAYFFLIGLSPWVSIPYTDSIGLLFPTLVLYLYFCLDDSRKRYILWALIAIFTVIGFKIKPQLLIITIAIVINEFIKLFEIKFTKKMFISIGTFCVAAMVTFAGINSLCKTLPMELDEERSFNIYHYIMMGFNPDDYGIYSPDDFAFSNSFDTVEERTEATKERISDRFEEMGVSGVIEQFERKTLINYNDGTFFWGEEGEFFVRGYEPADDFVSRLTRSIYYKRDFQNAGHHNKEWSNFQQMIWFTLLFMSLFCIFNRKDKRMTVIILAVIGISLFELIFEARSRYLYVYAPFYVLLAIYGINAIDFSKLIKRKRK